MNKFVLSLSLCALVAFTACGEDEPPAPNAQATEAETPSSSPSPSPEVEESPADEGPASDVSELIADLEGCLNDGGIETEPEEADLPIYGEKATVELTFDYGELTVPGAVTLWVYDSPEAAAKGKKEIDDNLLEGDTETLLRGQVVIDDFGNTLETPEAADQGEILESCTA